MPNIPEGMVQLNVPIPEDVRDLLDSEIIERCGYPKRGILGEVVTEALREFLYKRHTHTKKIVQTQKKVEAPKTFHGNSKSKYDILKQYIKDYGEQNNYRISPVTINDIVKRIMGVYDRRSITKYLDLLEEDFMIFPQKDQYYETTKPPKIQDT